jgi:RNA polymerase sigma-70 factor (ECF subfamily)
MKHFSCEYTVSEDDAEDIIQDIFLELYEKFDLLENRVNMVAYVFTAIKNRCIDHLRHKIVKQETARRMQEEHFLTLRMKFDSLEILEESLFDEEDMEGVIAKALNTLPERCRNIFIKHKIEGKKQKEIARELNISPKTVENQLTIAYRKLHEELKRFSLLFLLLL